MHLHFQLNRPRPIKRVYIGRFSRTIIYISTNLKYSKAIKRLYLIFQKLLINMMKTMVIAKFIINKSNLIFPHKHHNTIVSHGRVVPKIVFVILHKILNFKQMQMVWSVYKTPIQMPKNDFWISHDRLML